MHAKNTSICTNKNIYYKMCLCISEVKRRGERVEEIRKSCITRWGDIAEYDDDDHRGDDDECL